MARRLISTSWHSNGRMVYAALSIPPDTVAAVRYRPTSKYMDIGRRTVHRQGLAHIAANRMTLLPGLLYSSSDPSFS
ncbi:hypothetical protein LINGRAHAP2_LOCUS101 [Linum grandiflorum]